MSLWLAHLLPKNRSFSAFAPRKNFKSSGALKCKPSDRNSTGNLATEVQRLRPTLPKSYNRLDKWSNTKTRLKDALHFHNLASAEASLINLHAAYREYQRANDRAGIAWVQRLLRKGKRRAESLAANPKIRPEKQREKQEIAAWFRVWLQTPDLFFDWLELRKRSEEFQSLFGR